MSKPIHVHVVRHEDGTFWGSTQNLPGVVTAFGASLDELKENLRVAFEDYVSVAKDLGEPWVVEVQERTEWSFSMNMQALFDLVPELKITAIARRAGINESLMRQYASGNATVSADRVRYIEQSIHELGKQLQSVTLTDPKVR
jgi:predicted RNase H-like HicB family nuclease